MSISWLTRGDLKDEVKQIIHEQHTDVDTLLDGFLHDCHRQLEDEGEFEWLLVPNYPVTLVNGQESYILPNDFHKLHSGKDDRSEGDYIYIDTNIKCFYLTEWDFKSKYGLNVTQTGFPRNFRIGTYQGVNRNPTSPSTLTVFSSNAADTTISAFIKGVNSDGLDLQETITLNGTTHIVSTNTYASIDTFSISSHALGFVTCKSNAEAVTNIIIAPGQKSVRYQVIKFNPITDSTAAGRVARIWYYKHIPDLNSDNDVSIVPSPVFLKSYIRMRAFQFQNDLTNMQSEASAMTIALNSLKSNQNKQRFLRQFKVSFSNIRPI